MSAKTEAPYGSWKSPITAELIAANAVRLSEPSIVGDDVYWLEMRPKEEGRTVLVRQTADGRQTDVTDQGFNIRSRVHEYGGGAYTVWKDTVFFANAADQRVYRLDSANGIPLAITPEAAICFADLVVDPDRGLLFGIREDHRGEGEPENAIVKLHWQEDPSGGDIVAGGNDFYASPRLSPDGDRLAWLTWHHPNMPWDGTELWIGELSDDGSVAAARRIAGGSRESIFQPEWSPEGELYFVSDRTGWGNIYRLRDEVIEPVLPMAAEFGRPQWVFGMSTYGFDPAGNLVCTYSRNGRSDLGIVDTRTLVFESMEVPYADIQNLKASSGKVVFLGAAPTAPASIAMVDLETESHAVLKRSADVVVDKDDISVPETISFPNSKGQTAYGFYYPPCNRAYRGPPEEKPPLLVMSHSGPTGATTQTLNPKVQYWTSRGIAVVDVNYSGSTGYGREYQERLNGQWGVLDVDDCASAALYLANRGRVDRDRLAITGSSAGGYTTLCALTFLDVFRTGASHYGIGDLETLAMDTHKFESRYLDHLVGPYPDRRDVYVERSPTRHVGRLSCPMILFQGLEDRVVPPDQAEKMVAAVKAKGLPVAYLPFEGEQHGFRKAETIKRAIEAELYFYGKVLGFELAEPIEPVEMENL